MSKRRTTAHWVILAALVLSGAVALDGQSPATAITTQSRAESLSANAELEPALPQAAQVGELTALRTAESKTFELADGSYEWVGYTEAVHYRDSLGAFQEIDNNIVAEVARIGGADYAFRNAANEYTVRFGAQAGGLDPVSIEHEGRSVSFGLVGAQPSSATRTVDLGSRALSGVVSREDCITYSQVLPGVDLVYEAKARGVKEYFVLRDPAAQNEFTFAFDPHGLAAEQAGGRVCFVDAQGHGVFWLGDPVAFDDAETLTDEVAYEVIPGDGGTYQIKVTLSRAYLDDPARAFPVVVDPEVILYPPTADTYVASYSPSTNFVDSPYLRTGRSSSDGIRRTFIKFDLSGFDGDGDDVTDAHLRIERNTTLGGVTPLINAWWSLEYFASDSMTWSNGTPHWDGTSSDDFGSPESTLGALDGGTWYHMHVTTPVKRWLDGTSSNYGWMIKDQRESTAGLCTAFYSSNAGSPHRPELHIVYNKHVVYTRLACDRLFQDTVGGSWKTTARSALEQADNPFEAVFGIDFLLRSSEDIQDWVSPIDTCPYSPFCRDVDHYVHTDPWLMRADALAEVGLGAADVLACITKPGYLLGHYNPETYQMLWYGGQQEGSTCIVIHNYPNETWAALRHELGHFFYADDHYDGRDCVMTIDPEDLTLPHPWSWCQSCQSIIAAHKAKYD